MFSSVAQDSPLITGTFRENLVYAIDREVSEDELEKRQQALSPFEPKIKKGWLARYSKLVTNASKGGVMSI